MDGIEPYAKITGTSLAEGPWGRQNWAQQLEKSAKSNIEFLVRERESKNDFTMLAWLYIASTESSQISNPGSWGLTIKLVKKNFIPFIRLKFVQRPTPSVQGLAFDGLETNTWNFLAITFDPLTQVATLWANDQLVGSLKTNIYKLVYENHLWIGAKVKDVNSQHLKMRISCVQFFTASLTKEAMAKTKFVCKGL